MIQTKWLVGKPGLEAAREIREKVFVREQFTPRGEEFDNIDDYCDHLIVYDNGIPVGTGRLYVRNGEYIPSRIAVIKEARGKGIGDLIMKLLLHRGISKGAKSFRISAQRYAKGFYERYGFRQVGQMFIMSGIEHITMRCDADKCIFPSKCCSK
ncbi:MAG TPA: GNAT family N-acetyltransferase [Clostridia bacterium]|nr:GNAT family N-acetyltransferase [Clostridia bacterium]